MLGVTLFFLALVFEPQLSQKFLGNWPDLPIQGFTSSLILAAVFLSLEMER